MKSLLSILQNKKTGFVTRLKNNSEYEVTEQRVITEEIHNGVLSDEIIEVDVKEGRLVSKL